MEKHSETNAPGQLNGLVRPGVDDSKYLPKERAALCDRIGCKKLFSAVKYRMMFYGFLQHIGKSYLLCEEHAAEYERDKA